MACKTKRLLFFILLRVFNLALINVLTVNTFYNKCLSYISVNYTRVLFLYKQNVTITKRIWFVVVAVVYQFSFYLIYHYYQLGIWLVLSKNKETDIEMKKEGVIHCVVSYWIYKRSCPTICNLISAKMQMGKCLRKDLQNMCTVYWLIMSHRSREASWSIIWQTILIVCLASI